LERRNASRPNTQVPRYAVESVATCTKPPSDSVSDVPSGRVIATPTTVDATVQP
jgi:hypothetical protein